MEKLFVFALLFAFLNPATLTFAKPKDKSLKLNPGKVKKIEKIADDLDDDDEKGNKSGKKDKKDKDTELEKASKKTGKKLLKEAFK